MAQRIGGSLGINTRREDEKSSGSLMKICFVCKYPPIEGGVSMHGYWTARGLAEKGHNVFVVTNANEVESTFRIQLSPADLQQDGEYARSFPEVSGTVRVFSTEPPDRSRIYYVPMNNPTVTRLATIATNIIRAEDCKVIFAYYFEPYALAAHLASCWTHVPYVLKHAGSDLHNLALHEDLQTAYVEVMKGANRILSSGPSRQKIISYGVPKDRIVSGLTFKLPTTYFTPDGPTLDIESLLQKTADEASTDHVASYFEPLDSSLPVLGIYGKLGEYKGTFDLLRAMGHLISEGFRFYLVAMCRGWREAEFVRMMRELGIEKYVRVIPFQPHWKVPEFIRRCTAVAFLERDFPIKAHGPTIPTEVLACGKCVIISEEIARKQPFRKHLRNLQNIVIVPDPKEHTTLAQCIRFALEDQHRADAIGYRGLTELVMNQNHQAYLDEFEGLLLVVAAEQPVHKSNLEENARAEPVTDWPSVIAGSFPITWALLSEERRNALESAIRPTALNEPAALTPKELAARVSSFLDDDLDLKGSAIAEVCRYERLLQDWRDTVNQNGDRPLSSKTLLVSASRLAGLYPFINGEATIVEFSHDVQAIIAAVEQGTSLPEATNPIRVLIHFSSPIVKLNESTERLLEMLINCSGTTNELLTLMSEHYGCNDERSNSQLRNALNSVLERLYWEGVVDFAERPARSLS